MIYELPTALTFGGREWAINTDFRDVLVILLAFEDPDLDEQQKAYVCLHNLYVDDGEIPREQVQAAFEAALGFIDHGSRDDRPGPRTMDWEQDAALIFPAVNRVAGCEVRALPYCHWWTFCGWFMEIRDSTAATVFSLRSKKARGKKLEKWEKEYWAQNLATCKLKPRRTAAEREAEDYYKKVLGG